MLPLARRPIVIVRRRVIASVFHVRTKPVPFPIQLSLARMCSSLPPVASMNLPRLRRFPAPLTSKYLKDSPGEILHLLVALDLVV